MAAGAGLAAGGAADGSAFLAALLPLPPTVVVGLTDGGGRLALSGGGGTSVAVALAAGCAIPLGGLGLSPFAAATPLLALLLLLLLLPPPPLAGAGADAGAVVVVDLGGCAAAGGGGGTAGATLGVLAAAGANPAVGPFVASGRGVGCVVGGFATAAGSLDALSAGGGGGADEDDGGGGGAGAASVRGSCIGTAALRIDGVAGSAGLGGGGPAAAA